MKNVSKFHRYVLFYTLNGELRRCFFRALSTDDAISSFTSYAVDGAQLVALSCIAL